MKTLKIIAVTFLLSLITFYTTHSENLSSIKPIFCTVNSVNECVAWQGCQTATPFSANIPNFLNIDIANKIITSASNSHANKSTEIERIEIIDELITLSGAEPESSKNQGDKFGWIITIVKDTGQMILSANSNVTAYVIFGTCAHMSN